MDEHSLRSAERRFDRNVDRSGGPDACWPWTGTISSYGYGQLSVGPRRGGRTIRAHRFAWERAHGPIPEDQQVCHRCDHRPCCNPAHLFVGSSADNQHDKRDKGRAARGEANGGGGKLTEADVLSIRARAGAVTNTALALEFGVSRQMVAMIVNRKQWRHI